MGAAPSPLAVERAPAPPACSAERPTPNWGMPPGMHTPWSLMMSPTRGTLGCGAEEEEEERPSKNCARCVASASLSSVFCSHMLAES